LPIPTSTFSTGSTERMTCAVPSERHARRRRTVS
jgi:hypothetical protein